MENFESKISNTLGAHIVRSCMVFLFLFLGLKFLLRIDFLSIPIEYYIILIIFYIIFTYIYIGRTNNDFVVFDNRVEIINRVPLFKKKTVIYFNEIKLVLFRHEWTESMQEKIKPRTLGYIITEYILSSLFPSDYKWIEFDSGKRKRFNCFGLEFDYYDNERPIIEDLFYTLAKNNINVKWTNTSLNYYAGMMKNIEDKRNAST